MPTYDYACRDCDHRFEAVQSIHDDALTTCPDCGGELRKVVGAVGIHFKGSGFYRTDSRKDAKGSKGAGKTADSSPAATKDAASEAPSGDGAAGKTSEAGSSASTDSGASGPSSSDSTNAKPAAKPAGSDTKK